MRIPLPCFGFGHAFMEMFFVLFCFLIIILMCPHFFAFYMSDERVVAKPRRSLRGNSAAISVCAQPARGGKRGILLGFVGAG